MKNNYVLILCLLLLLLIPAVLAQTAVWNGQEYKTKEAPPNEIIDLVKEKIISLGISENYFDKHFKLVYASISSWSAEKGWQQIEVQWNYTINEEYSLGGLGFFVRIYKQENGSLVSEALDSPTAVPLHEIEKTIQRKEAEDKLKQCPKNYRSSVFGKVSLINNGNLVLWADGPAGVANVNLETGELSCEAFIPKALSTSPLEVERSSSTYLFYIGIGLLILIIVFYFVFKRKNITN